MVNDNGMTRKLKIVVNADLADVVRAERAMQTVWAILMALAQTKEPQLKEFQLEVLNEELRYVDAGLDAIHKHLLRLAENGPDTIARPAKGERGKDNEPLPCQDILSQIEQRVKEGW